MIQYLQSQLEETIKQLNESKNRIEAKPLDTLNIREYIQYEQEHDSYMMTLGRVEALTGILNSISIAR